ncbi:hypothetical protein B0J13DRAFT_463478 [Dactylonectria estremocensis]|uniref:Uncharacterized protein n=1 Tax=Dactylonectria estremocensis TaxID=1079267 RepID=A0A9P9JE14_9HYPO|nr:hypothetical protein B0J13DRAFT_463478 [Dactylonectria estremocensis]
MTHDVDVLIIGAGMSGIGLAIQLVRKHGTRNFELIEKSEQLGGTWWLNSYPGCGCDVPSHFFSYSFALNPNWTQKFAMQPEIHAYFKQVARKYDIDHHVKFQSVVESAIWEDDCGTWLVTIRDLKTTRVTQRRCKILISAVGALSTPKKCDIPGASEFQGRLFHTAEWDHSFDWKGKDLVVMGNGCSATQIVPVISEGDGAVKQVTQFSRQAHWLADRPNPQYSASFKWMMNWVPFAMRIYRAKLYWEKERDFKGFNVKSGEEIRKGWMADAADYIRKNAPKKYLDFIVPKSEIGCKRRVNDTDYLLSLHRDNVELVYSDPVEEILHNGVRTKSGRLVDADAIVLANGFETQKFLFPMNIQGENGVGLTDHWDRVSEGASSAYLGTCVSGFPNFFIMMGPNTLSGHLSVIYTTECQINFTMRVIAPVMQALRNSRSILQTIRSTPDIVVVTADAERRDLETVQDKAKQLVWATGCTSWFIEASTGRNTIMYPDWQYTFWLRSVFVAWKDFAYRTSEKSIAAGGGKRKGPGMALAVLLSAIVGVGALFLNQSV